MSKPNPSQRKRLKLKKLEQAQASVEVSSDTDNQPEGGFACSYEEIYSFYMILVVIGLITLGLMIVWRI